MCILSSEHFKLLANILIVLDHSQVDLMQTSNNCGMDLNLTGCGRVLRRNIATLTDVTSDKKRDITRYLIRKVDNFYVSGFYVPGFVWLDCPLLTRWITIQTICVTRNHYSSCKPLFIWNLIARFYRNFE